MTYLELAKDEALQHGITLSDKDANFILWEHTGFPDFFSPLKEGETHEDVVRREVSDFVKTIGKK